MMYPGHIISGINIQFRGFDKKLSIPKLYTIEHTSFTSIPKSEYLINAFNDYKMFLNKPEVSVLIFTKYFLLHYLIIIIYAITLGII